MATPIKTAASAMVQMNTRELILSMAVTPTHVYIDRQIDKHQGGYFHTSRCQGTQLRSILYDR